MNTAVLRRIIEDQRDDMEGVMRRGIIERDGIKNVKGFLEYPNILTILGVRRCGKSVFSFLVFKGRSFGYVNLGDDRFSDFQIGDFDSLLEAFYGIYGRDLNCFVLDEVQSVKGWESFASRLRVNNMVIITGSNSKLLSSELATALTGRRIEYTLFPFSFMEFLRYKGVDPNIYLTRDIGVVKKHIEEYLHTGGFPEAYRFGRHMIMGIYNDIIEKDVRARYSIRKIGELRNMARYLVTNSSKEVSYNRLKNVLGLNISTVKNYAEYLSTPYLIFFIDKFSYKLKEQFLSPRKVYCADNGIINTVSFKFSEDLGRLMENCVAVKLIGEKLNNPGTDLFYWKDYQQNEVDFVQMRDERVERLVQVTHASERDEIDSREINGLLKAAKELRCKDLAIITWDYEDVITIGNRSIRCIPLWKWLITGF